QEASCPRGRKATPWSPNRSTWSASSFFAAPRLDHVHDPPLGVVVELVELAEERFFYLRIIEVSVFVNQVIGGRIEDAGDIDQLLRRWLALIAIFQLPEVAFAGAGESRQFIKRKALSFPEFFQFLAKGRG